MKKIIILLTILFCSVTSFSQDDCQIGVASPRCNGTTLHQDFVFFTNLSGINDFFLVLEDENQNILELYPAIPNQPIMLIFNQEQQNKSYFIYIEYGLNHEVCTAVKTQIFIPSCTSIDNDSDGYTADVDCDDSNPNTYPGAEEICDNRDNNCNGEVDEGLTRVDYYYDADLDGYGDPNRRYISCRDPGGRYVTIGGDCDDSDPNVNPGATEEPGNGKDDDCNPDTPDDDCTAGDEDNDGVCADTDCNDNDPNIGAPTTWYADVDGDGYGDPNDTTEACQQPNGYINNSDDLEINSPCPENVNANGVSADSDNDGVADCNDSCPGFDDNIDSDNDGTPDGCDTCQDADEDGVCAESDCNDNDPNIGAATTWYADVDGDGYGDPNDTTEACQQPNGYVNNSDDQEINSPCPDNVNDNGVSADSDNDGVADCNDICQGFDDNIDSDNDGTPDGCDTCQDADNDGVCADIDCNDNDNNIGAPTTWYADVDGDGYGDPNDTTEACQQPNGYVNNSDDLEINSPCPENVNDNGVSDDSDGDGVADCNDSCPGFDDNIDSDNDGTPDGCDTCQDADEDGVCAESDCNDNDNNIGAPTTWYADVDGDGYGDPNNTTEACQQPNGYVNNSNDLEINSPCPENVNANGVSADSDNDGVADCNDICQGFDDNIDSDNDGTPDGCDTCQDADEDGVCAESDCNDNDPNIGAATTWYADVDGDGYGDPNDTTEACQQPNGYVNNSNDQEINSPCPENVNANGVSADSDNDGVADCQDTCQGFDDNIDSDNDGTPDGCDTCQDEDNDSVCADLDCNDNNPNIGAATTWYADVDGDGYGDPNDTLEACQQPDGYVNNSDDLEINSPCPQNVNANGVSADSDQDGVADCQDICQGFDDNIDSDNDGTPDGCDTCQDADEDGICAETDCNDNDPNIGAATTWYADVDGDGYGDPNNTTEACQQPNGYVNNSDDLEINSPCPGNVNANGVSADSDKDGTPDCDDLCPDDQFKTEPGDCGCGNRETDRDMDGVADCNDLEINSPCPDLVDENGVSIDSDNDGTPDCDDLCPGSDDTNDTDGDRIPDGCDENPDCRGDRILICHVSKNESTTEMCIAPNQLQRHRDHGDALGKCNVAQLELKTISDENLVVYPNPSSGKFSIELKDQKLLSETVNISIRNSVGVEVYQTEVPPNNLIELDAQSSIKTEGLYFITVSNSHTSYVRSLIISK